MTCLSQLTVSAKVVSVAKMSGRQTDVSKKEYIHTKCPRRVQMESCQKTHSAISLLIFCLQFSPHFDETRYEDVVAGLKSVIHVSSLPYKISQPKTESTKYFHIR